MNEIWRKLAVDELQRHEARKCALTELPARIAELNTRMLGYRSVTADSIPAKGGGSGKEDAYLNAIVIKDNLEKSIRSTAVAVSRVEKALGVLSNEDVVILDRFYIHPEKSAAARLACDLGIDEKTVYRRKDACLRKFVVAMFGEV